MSKARELASLVSNSRDLADGASTGGEAKFEASGAIEANKPLILKSDNTVEQIKVATTSSSLLNTVSLGAGVTEGYMTTSGPSAAYHLLDMLLDGDYIYAVYRQSSQAQVYLTVHSIDSNNDVTFNSIHTLSQQWSNPGFNDRAYIVKTANGFLVVIHDTDESYGDGRATVYPFTNVGGTITVGTSATHGDVGAPYRSRAMARPLVVSDDNTYVVVNVYADSSNIWWETYEQQTDGSVTTEHRELGTLQSIDEGNNQQVLTYNPNLSTDQFVVFSGRGTPNSSTINYETGDWNLNDDARDGNSGSLPGASSITGITFHLRDSTYESFDIVYSDYHDKYILLTNDATTTRVTLYDYSGSVFSYVSHADYPATLGGCTEFFRSLQVDDTTGRFYINTFDHSTDVATIITGTISPANEPYFLVSETVTIANNSYDSEGRPIIAMDVANNRFAFGQDFQDAGGFYTRVGLVTTGSAVSINIGDGSLIGVSKEACADGEYVTTAINGGIANLTGLTQNTHYFVDIDGDIVTTGTDWQKTLGTALNTTQLRVDTDVGYLGKTNLGTNESSRVVTTNAGGNISMSGNLFFEDSDRAYFGSTSNERLSLYYNNAGFIDNSNGHLYITNYADDRSIYLRTDNGAGGATTYLSCDGISGEVILNHYNFAKLTTKSTGVDITGELNVDSYNETYAAVTSTTNATTVDCETGNSFSHTLTENTTFTFSNPPASGTAYSMSIEIIQDASASGFTVTWPTSVDWPNATAPTLTATASAKDVFVFTTRDGGVTWYGFTAGQALG